MSQKPSPYRKAASSFVTDPSNINLMEFSPRIDTFNLENRRTFPVTNHTSNSNFIGDSVFLPEGPRAVAVSGSGEKRIIELDADSISTSSNAFTVHSPSSTAAHHFSTLTMPRILEQSSSHISLSGTDKSTIQSSSKLTKKLKSSRRNVTLKNRSSFIQRNIDKTSSTRQLKSKNLKTCSLPKPQIPTLLPTRRNTSTETHSNYTPPASSCIPQRYNSIATDRVVQMSIPIPKNDFSESLWNKSIEGTQKLSQPPLKIYTKTNPNLSKYSELRGIASALTLITVISWLFSIFFDLGGLLDFFDNIVVKFQNWYSTKEKPKTKAELVVKFIQDFWT